VLALGADRTTISHIHDKDVIVDHEDDDSARSSLVMGLVRGGGRNRQKVLLCLVATFLYGCVDVAREL